MILSGNTINNLCTHRNNPRDIGKPPSKPFVPMIHDFIPEKVSSVDGKRVISYGLQGSGYDVRLGSVYRVRHKNDRSAGEFIDYGHIVDPKFSDMLGMHEIYPEFGNTIILSPHDTVLGVTVERFSVPLHIRGTCEGKSTYARIHVITHVTPLEPGWGLLPDEPQYLTLEIANLSNEYVAVYLNEGIAQIKFEMLDRSVRAYKGYYQNQTEQVPYLPMGG